MHLLGETAALDVGQQEGLHQVLDEGLVVVVAPLEALQVLVHLLLPQVGHDTGLPVRSPLYSVPDDPVEVGVHCALVHLHDFLVQALLSCSDYILSISATRLLNFSASALIFSLIYFLLDLVLLSYPHQLLRELVKGLCNDLTLQSFVHCVSEAVFMLFEEDVFCLVLREVGDLGDDE